jgi:thiamine-phosphate pyrophosphorylase
LLLYYITDRTQFSGDEVSRRIFLLDKIGEAAACGVDFIQLRERDLAIRELEALARDAVRVVRENSVRASTFAGGNPHPKTLLLVNSRTDVAIASAAHGVHLRSDDISARDARFAWGREAAAREGERKVPVLGVSCHTPSEVERAKGGGADFAVFGPVFGKKNGNDPGVSRAAGLDLLRQACAHKIPVLALGGITAENACNCMAAGAVGIAAIRLFQENEIEQVVRRLRINPSTFPRS